MKMYLLSENRDTLTGMNLAGIEGSLVGDKDELREKLDVVLSDKQIGILLVTEYLYKKYTDMIDDVKLGKKLPLVVNIPDRNSAGRKPDFLTSYINEAIGLKL